MKKTSIHAPWWAGALLAAGATFAVQGSAHAQSCEADADCGAGYTCKIETYESCYGGWDCTEDGECTRVDEVCETYTSSWCANANCEADADCPSFMACQPQTTWVCEGSGMGGAGGTAGGTAGTGAGGFAGGVAVDGGMEPPQTCEEVPAPSVCIPRYDLPCETASDCGGGFDCVETYYWMCEGGMGGFGGGAAGTGAGGAPAAADAGVDGDGPVEADGGSSVCELVPSGSNACQLQDLPCDATSDCPEGLECLEQYVYGPCTGGAGGTGGASGTGGVGGMPVDGGAIECPEPEIEHKCMPRSYGGGGGMGGIGGGGSGSGGSTGGEVDAGVEGPGMGGASGTSAAGMGGGAGGVDEDDDSDEDDGHGHGRGRGWLKRLLGCSTSGPVSSEGSFGWLMLGVAALVWRRRSRGL